MGQFSFTFADRSNKENLLVDTDAWLLQPDGNHIHEACYDGYGHFGGYDVYDLVVDWNKEFLSHSMVNKPDRSNWAHLPDGEESYQYALKKYEHTILVMDKYKSGASETEMTDFCRAIDYGIGGRDWKRLLGIRIANGDEKNAALPYPIKICRESQDYFLVSASKDDPNQGWAPLEKSDENEDEYESLDDEIDELEEFLENETDECLDDLENMDRER